MPEPSRIDRARRYVLACPVGMTFTTRSIARALNCSAEAATETVRVLVERGVLVRVNVAGQPTIGPGSLRVYQIAPRHERDAFGAAPAPLPGDTLERVAEQFVGYWLRNGGCGMCGGVPHSTTCFVARMAALLERRR